MCVLLFFLISWSFSWLLTAIGALWVVPGCILLGKVGVGETQIFFLLLDSFSGNLSLEIICPKSPVSHMVKWKPQVMKRLPKPSAGCWHNTLATSSKVNQKLFFLGGKGTLPFGYHYLTDTIVEKCSCNSHNISEVVVSISGMKTLKLRWFKYLD